MSVRRLSAALRAALPVLILSAAGVAQAVPEVLYYKFNEGGGATTANQAVPGQGATNPTITGHQLSPTGGQFGGSLAGVTQTAGLNRVNTNWTMNLGSNSWTIGFWIDLGGQTATVSYPFGDTATGFRCFVNSTAGAGGISLRGPLTNVDSGAGAIATGGHYVHYVYDTVSLTIRLYIDGVLFSTVGQPGGVTLNGTSAFQVGGFTGNSAESLLTGMRMDEFRVYSRALGAAEISATWNADLQPSGLFANFSSSATSGAAPLTVAFTDTSVSTNGPINSWLWNFGDGATSSMANPTHTFSTVGNFTVSLTVDDGVAGPTTLTRTDYIVTDRYAFSMTTSGGGVGDVSLVAAPPPPGTTEGFSFFSLTPANPMGSGNFFGIVFDGFVLNSLQTPATPGNPFHWVPSPGQYPAVPFTVGPGTLSNFAGVTADGVVLYVVNGQLVPSEISRATF